MTNYSCVLFCYFYHFSPTIGVTEKIEVYSGGKEALKDVISLEKKINNTKISFHQEGKK